MRLPPRITRLGLCPNPVTAKRQVLPAPGTRLVACAGGPICQTNGGPPMECTGIAHPTMVPLKLGAQSPVCPTPPVRHVAKGRRPVPAFRTQELCVFAPPPLLRDVPTLRDTHLTPCFQPMDAGGNPGPHQLGWARGISYCLRRTFPRAAAPGNLVRPRLGRYPFAPAPPVGWPVHAGCAPAAIPGFPVGTIPLPYAPLCCPDP